MLREETRVTLDLYAPQAEYRDVSADESAYWRLLRDLWADGESFVLVEHDVEIGERTVPDLEGCPEPWCVCAFRQPIPEGCRAPVAGGWFAWLGCVRFSAELIARYPDMVADFPRDWRRLDNYVATALMARGEGVHRHPAVVHHHRGSPSLPPPLRHAAHPLGERVVVGARPGRFASGQPPVTRRRVSQPMAPAMTKTASTT